VGISGIGSACTTRRNTEVGSIAEIELSMFSRQCLGTRRIPDLATLKRETKAWNRKANQKRTKINWRFTRKKAIDNQTGS